MIQDAASGPVQGAFRALADPTRREILRLLAEQDMTIGEVAGQFDMTRPAIKKHLTILELGDLIRVRPSGRERINSLQPRGLKTVTDWLEHFDQFWDERLAALQEAVEAHELKEKEKQR